MSPARLRAYVLIITRDVLPPIIGAFLCVYLPVTDEFEVWQLPLLAGLLMVPLVGKDGTSQLEPRTDARPVPEEE